jgi:hypothetical protein
MQAKRKKKIKRRRSLENDRSRRKLAKLKRTYITNTDKKCELLEARPALPSGKTPHDNNTTNVLITARSGHEAQRRSMPGRTH